MYQSTHIYQQSRVYIHMFQSTHKYISTKSSAYTNVSEYTTYIYQQSRVDIHMYHAHTYVSATVEYALSLRIVFFNCQVICVGAGKANAEYARPFSANRYIASRIEHCSQGGKI